MTQLDTGAPPSTPMAGAADAASAGAAPPSVANEGSVMTPGLRDILTKYGGDEHRLGQLARLGQEVESSGLTAKAQRLSAQFGLTLDDVMEILTNGEGDTPPETTEGHPMQTHQTEQQPATPQFDPDEFRQSLLSEFKGVLDERDQTAQQRAQQEEQMRRYREGLQAEQDAAKEFLKSLKLEDESDHRYGIAEAAFQRAVLQQKAESVPSWIADAQQRQQYFNQPATAEMLQAASEATRKGLADFKLDGASEFANSQEPTAGASLGSGPGASTTAPDGDSMSQEQQDDFVFGHVKEDVPG